MLTELDILISSYLEDQTTPLFDFVVEHPKCYYDLALTIRAIEDEIHRCYMSMDGSDCVAELSGQIHENRCHLTLLRPVRDRIADWLGYEEREDIMEGFKNCSEEFIARFYLPEEDEFGFPLYADDDYEDYDDRWGPEDGGLCPCGGTGCDGTCDSN